MNVDFIFIFPFPFFAFARFSEALMEAKIYIEIISDFS